MDTNTTPDVSPRKCSDNLRGATKFRYDAALVEHVRNAAAALPNRVTVTAIVENGVRRQLNYMWKHLNDGKPFPAVPKNTTIFKIPANRAIPDSGRGRVSLSMRLSTVQVDHIRNAVAAITGETMTNIIEVGIRRELEYLWRYYNNGKPFPARQTTKL